MNNEKQYSVSVVVPIYNEEGNVKKLHEEILRVFQHPSDGITYDYEILFVNDGSTDHTDDICRTLSPLNYIRFDRNYGQTAALDAGFHAASKERIVAMDGDGQNDPADIPLLLQKMDQRGLDVISGWRKKRADRISKKIVSRGAYILRQIILQDGIHDSGCTLKVYKRECFDHLHLVKDQHRFIVALLQNRGYKAGEQIVHHRPRTSGTSKYGWHRIVNGFSDMLAVRSDKKRGNGCSNDSQPVIYRVIETRNQ